MDKVNKFINSLPLTIIDKARLKDILKGSIGGGITSVTSNEVLALKDNKQLIPGSKYRITDYEFIPPVNDYLPTGSCGSGNHPFDIILTALTEDTFDVHASAINKDYSEMDKNTYNMMLLDDDRAFRAILVNDHSKNPYNCRYEFAVHPEDKEIFGDTDFRFYSNTINDHDCEIDVLEKKSNEHFRTLAYIYKDNNSDYFANNNLAAWELKVELTNGKAMLVVGDLMVEVEEEIEPNTIRFDWDTDESYKQYKYKVSFAGTTNYIYTTKPYTIDDTCNVPIEDFYGSISIGPIPADMLDMYSFIKPKGNVVITYMKDEFNNEADYDFKNLIYYKYNDTTIDKYIDSTNPFNPSSDFKSCYTFNDYSQDICEDLSISGYTHDCSVCNDLHKPFGNVMRSCYSCKIETTKNVMLVSSHNTHIKGEYTIGTAGIESRSRNSYFNSCNNVTIIECYRSAIYQYMQNVMIALFDSYKANSYIGASKLEIKEFKA